MSESGDVTLTSTMTFAVRPKPRWGQGDLHATPLTDLLWSADQAETSLAKVFDHVRRDAMDAADWYWRARKPKRWIAKTAQVVGIAAVGSAGIIPLVDGALPAWTIDSLWISIVLAVGGGVVAFDRHISGSKGWIRYVKAEQQVRNALETFELEWQAERATWNGAQPSSEQVSAMLKRAQSFAAEINAIVEEETKVWGEDFVGSLKQIEESLKARQEERKARVASEGALNLKVTNGHESDGGWKLKVDDSAEATYTGTTAAIPRLAPGRHIVKLHGTISGKEVKAERIINISPDTTSAEEIVLT